MLRYLAVGVAVIAAIAVALVLRLEYVSFRDVPFPSDAELQASFSRATAWAWERREQLLKEDNAMLWLFIREAATASADPHLLQLAQDYQARLPEHNLWRFIFDFSDRGSIAARYIELPVNFPDYNRLFIFSES